MDGNDLSIDVIIVTIKLQEPNGSKIKLEVNTTPYLYISQVIPISLFEEGVRYASGDVGNIHKHLSGG